MVDLQVTPEQPAQVAGDGAQRGVIQLGSPLGEVLHQQVPDGPALDAVAVHDLRDAAAPLDPQRPQPRRRPGGEHAGVLEQGVEQRPARAAPEMVLFQGSGQLQAVAHGDVADQAALADHHPGDLVQRIRAGPGRRVPGLDLQAAEGTGVEGGPGLGEHHRHPLAQQPPVAGPDDLPGHEQDEAREQLVAVMTPDRDTPLQRQFSPAEADGVGPAGQPSLLPGVSGLPLEPVQQLGQPAPPGLVPGQARARIGEQA
jgi:hypothetical protein